MASKKTSLERIVERVFATMLVALTFFGLKAMIGFEKTVLIGLVMLFTELAVLRGSPLSKDKEG